MKNVSKILVFIFIASMCLTACEKEQLNQTPQNPKSAPEIYFNTDRLTFNNVEAYEKTISELSTPATIKNLEKINEHPLKNVKQLKNGMDKDELYDEFLLSILNEDYIVQIGEWIIKVDMEKKIVSVISEENSSFMENLIDGVANDSIYKFSTSDDILDLLKEGSHGTIDKPQLKGLFCNEGKASDHNGFHEEWAVGFDGGQIVQCRYFQAGLYFSLYSRVSNTTNGTPISQYYAGESASLTMTLNYTFRSRCGRSYDRNNVTETWVTDYASAERIKRVYESSVNLSRYILKTDFILEYYKNGVYIQTNYTSEEIQHGM